MDCFTSMSIQASLTGLRRKGRKKGKEGGRGMKKEEENGGEEHRDTEGYGENWSTEMVMASRIFHL